MDEAKISFQKQAEEIESSYRDLQKKCKDPEQKKAIDVGGIVAIMEHMVKHFGAPHSNVFAKGFLGHLRIISELVMTDHSITLLDHFQVVTRLLCEMCSKLELEWQFIISMLVQWSDFVGKLSCTAKIMIFNELKSTAFVNCARLLINAPCISLSFLMVNILCSYLQIDSYPVVKIGSLFDGIAGQRTVNSIESIKCKSNGMSLRDKFRLLERINHMKQAIYSELIYTLKFGEVGEKIAFDLDGGRLYFNKSTKSMEFCVAYKPHTVIILISAKKLKTVQVIDSDHGFVQNLKLILDAPPRLETINGKSIELPEFKSTTIDVNFDTGIYRSRLDSMLLDMFGIVPETLERLCESAENENIELAEDNLNDSDIAEIISLSPKSCKYLRTSSLTNRTDAAKPIQSDTKKTRAKRTAPKSTETKIVIAPTTKRVQRAAAQKAVQGINKSLESTIYEFEDVQPPVKRKVANKPQSPVSQYTGIGRMKRIGKREPRKLWSQKENQMELNDDDSDGGGGDDAQKSKEGPTKRRLRHNTVDVELTPTSFRKSIYNNQDVQISHMLENASRINEDVKKTQKDGTAQSNGPEDVDINANRKQCCCQLLEMELNNIGKLTRKALARLYSNEYVCTKCGGSAQRTSQ